MRDCACSTSTSGKHSARISACARNTGAYCSARVPRTLVGRGVSSVGTARGDVGARGGRHASTLARRPEHDRAPVTSLGSVWLVHGAESRVLGDDHSRDPRELAECMLHALIDEARELLARRHEPAITELWYIQIDVRVIEPCAHLTLQHVVEHA